MGNFITPHEVKDKATVTNLRQMDLEALDDLYIYPAEAAVVESCNLGLDTDLNPYGYKGRFEKFPDERTAFRDAMRRAVLLTVNRWAANPTGFKSQSVGGASVTYDSQLVPSNAMVLLKKWTRARTVYRA